MAVAGRILGVHVAASVAYLALVERPSAPHLSDPVKVATAPGLVDGVLLKDFGDRFYQEVRRVSAEVVVLAHTKKYGGWSYADAFARASLEATILLVLASSPVKCCVLKQDRAAKTLGFKRNKGIESLAATIEHEGTLHWKERAPALLVALACAQGAGP